MNDFVELQHLFSTILRRWWIFVLITLLAAGVGYEVTRRQPKVYEATATVLIGESIKSAQLDRTDIQTSQALVQTYVDIARRQPVLLGVVKQLNLQESWQDLRQQIVVKQVPETQLIEIRVQANSPDAAVTIADEITHQMLLISPANSAAALNNPIDDFNQRQVTDLQQKIMAGQRRLSDIEVELSKPTISLDERDALLSEKASLENLVVEWGRNYTEMLPFTIGTTQKDPSQLTVIETAHAAPRPVRPNVPLNTAISALVGMILALGLIFLLDFLDDTYKRPEDISSSEDVKLLGSIGGIVGAKYSSKLITQHSPRSPLTESYRIIRSRLRFRPLDKSTRTLLITSSLPGEGKSVTAANLAVVFAQANLKTILVDADLRKPSLHKLLGLQNTVGLGDLLESTEPGLDACLQDSPVKNLRFLASGTTLADPSERLGSERMTEILAELNRSADIVVFDSPPALIFADAIDLSRRMDGVVLVVRAGKSKRDSVNQVLFDFDSARAKVLGIIFNDAPRSRTSSIQGAYFQDRTRLARMEARSVTAPLPITGAAVAMLPEAEDQPEAEMSGPEDVPGMNDIQLTPDSNNGHRHGKHRRH